MRKYVSYCRTKCAPRLSPEAARKLSNHYVSMRSDIHKYEGESGERSSIPVTIRQLEAVVRISEAIAKISLSPIAAEQHVDEALRLFRVSTMNAVLSGHSGNPHEGALFLVEGTTRPQLLGEIEQVERVLQSRLAIGTSCSFQSLVSELTSKKAFSILSECCVGLFRGRRLQSHRDNGPARKAAAEEPEKATNKAEISSVPVR